MDVVTWVGFELLDHSSELGIRSGELHGSFDGIDTSPVRMLYASPASKRAGRRDSCVVGAMEHERPLLGPRHRYTSLGKLDAMAQFMESVAMLIMELATMTQGV